MTVVTVSALSMNSCKEDMPYLFSAEEEYTRNFIKTFGVIDPAQDWNLAQAAEVTVNAGDRAASVKVYCKVSDKYYIVADLKDVSGSVRVPIDVPEGSNDLMVKIDGKKYYTTIGGTVDPAMSRASAVPDDFSSLFTFGTEYYTFNTAAALSYDSKVPEDKDNIQKVPANFVLSTSEDLTIYPMMMCSSSLHRIGLYVVLDDVLPSGMSYAENDMDAGAHILVSQVHGNQTDGWETENPIYDEKGLYHYDENGELVEVTKDYGEFIANIFKIPFYTTANSSMSQYRTSPTGSWQNFSGNLTALSIMYNWNSYLELRAQPITIHVADIVSYMNSTYRLSLSTPLRFGLYCDVLSNNGNSYSHTVYSNATLNFSSTIYENYGGKLDDDGHWSDSFASYFETEFDIAGDGVADDKRTFIGFEDWANSPAVCDLNDVLFMVKQDDVTKVYVDETPDDDTDDPDPNTDPEPDPDPVDPEDPEDPVEPEDPEEDTPLSWLIAAEDLGTTDDFDFNDVVFSITSVTTNADSETPVKSIKVKALAAGGTLPVWLHFVSNGTDYVVAPNAGSDGNPLVLASEAGEDHEWHQAWFGCDNSLMLNTGQREATGAEVTLPSDITIDFNVEDYSSHVSTGMKGFYISVTDPNPGNNVQNVGGAANGYAIVGSAPSEGMAHAPQMFLIPDAGAESEGGKWCWPSERRHILEVYPSFKEWVGDAAGASTWYLTAPTPSTYYSR